MRKLLVLLVVVMLFLVTAGSALAASGPAGPAPNSGDGVHDGSGFEEPFGPYGDTDVGTGPAPDSSD
ncbi:hypothetical protein ACFLUT_02965 [Chloroflexota bacterium]